MLTCPYPNCRHYWRPRVDTPMRCPVCKRMLAWLGGVAVEVKRVKRPLQPAYPLKRLNRSAYTGYCPSHGPFIIGSKFVRLDTDAPRAACWKCQIEENAKGELTLPTPKGGGFSGHTD